jgi:hypothetical protein
MLRAKKVPQLHLQKPKTSSQRKSEKRTFYLLKKRRDEIKARMPRGIFLFFAKWKF